MPVKNSARANALKPLSGVDLQQYYNPSGPARPTADHREIVTREEEIVPYVIEARIAFNSSHNRLR